MSTESFTFIEVIALLTGLLGVWLTVKRNILCFPAGIVNVALYAYIFASEIVRLYADALLQCIYIILLIYGWYMWNKRKAADENIVPGRLSKKQVFEVTSITAVSVLILGYFFSRFTDAALPWLDSVLTCSSLTAQWMIARRKIENWLVWIVVDIIYIPLYISRELPLTAGLYTVFLLLAIKGYFEWRKMMTSDE